MKNALCNLWLYLSLHFVERVHPKREIIGVSALLNLDMADQPELRIYCEFDGVARIMWTSS